MPAARTAVVHQLAKPVGCGRQRFDLLTDSPGAGLDLEFVCGGYLSPLHLVGRLDERGSIVNKFGLSPAAELLLNIARRDDDGNPFASLSFSAAILARARVRLQAFS